MLLASGVVGCVEGFEALAGFRGEAPGELRVEEGQGVGGGVLARWARARAPSSFPELHRRPRVPSPLSTHHLLKRDRHGIETSSVKQNQPLSAPREFPPIPRIRRVFHISVASASSPRVRGEPEAYRSHATLHDHYLPRMPRCDLRTDLRRGRGEGGEPLPLHVLLRRPVPLVHRHRGQGTGPRRVAPLDEAIRAVQPEAAPRTLTRPQASRPANSAGAARRALAGGPASGRASQVVRVASTTQSASGPWAHADRARRCRRRRSSRRRRAPGRRSRRDGHGTPGSRHAPDEAKRLGREDASAWGRTQPGCAASLQHLAPTTVVLEASAYPPARTRSWPALRDVLGLRGAFETGTPHRENFQAQKLYRRVVPRRGIDRA